MSKTPLRSLRGPAAQWPNDPSTRDALRIRQDFQDEKPKQSYSLDFTWPTRLYEVGQGRSFGYTSNKWQERAYDFEDYKHVAEGPQRTFITSLVKDSDPHWRAPEDGGAWPSFRLSGGHRFPKVVAELAPCLFLEVRPFVRVVDGRGKFGDHAARIETYQSVLYAGRLLSPSNQTGACFVAVCNKDAGVLAVVFGPDLGVTKDGIVG